MTCAGAPSTKPPIILIVDDVPENLKLLTEILTLRGYDVRLAASGQAALQSVGEQAPDLIILDIRMPDLDGHEVCRCLKSQKTSATIPIIFISGLDAMVDKVKSFKAGGVDYITKPFYPAEVLARVESHLTLRQLQKEKDEQNDQLQNEIAERKKIESELEKHRAHLEDLVAERTAKLHEEMEERKKAEATLEDIATQHEMEKQLHRAQKLEAIGRLAAGIAHEINTPTQFVSDNLSFLKGAFADLLAFLAVCRRAITLLEAMAGQESLVAELRATEAQADLDYLTANGPGAFEGSQTGLKRIASIVSAMKEFSHPNSREMAPANLNATLENTLTIATNEYKYVADVEKDFGDIPPILCHAGDLAQVFLNLIVNSAHAIDEAMKKTGQRGMIRVSTCLEPGFVRIEIADTGIGIPEAVRAHVFEPFFTTKELGKGTGQGLAIAHSVVVRQHQGTLTFKSEVDKGTTFIVRLPVIESPAG